MRGSDLSAEVAAMSQGEDSCFSLDSDCQNKTNGKVRIRMIGVQQGLSINESQFSQEWTRLLRTLLVPTRSALIVGFNIFNSRRASLTEHSFRSYVRETINQRRSQLVIGDIPDVIVENSGFCGEPLHILHQHAQRARGRRRPWQLI